MVNYIEFVFVSLKPSYFSKGEALGTLIISLPCALEGQHRFWICYLKE